MKVGIIGCGGIAVSMARTLKGLEEQTGKLYRYAVASRSSEKASAFATEWGFSKAYGSYEDLVKDPEVELIYIATPHSAHYENMKLCIDAGKPVLCEKAFTVTAEQAIDILAYAEEKKVLVTEAMWVRYMPFVKRIKELLDSGIIGEMSTMTSNLHYQIDHVKRLYDPTLAGGALLDVGVYTLTFASIVFGDDIKGMNAVCVKFDTGVDSQNCVVLFYNDGKMAVLNSGTKALSDRKGIIYGRKGFMVVENINNPESVSVYDNNYQLILHEEAPKQITGYEYQVLACEEAIKAGKLECEDMPHSETITIMKWMDEARAMMGIEYPL